MSDNFYRSKADGYACSTEQLLDVLVAVSCQRNRLTLGIKFVLAQETAKEVVECLLKQLRKLEIKGRCLYLDRDFGSMEIARYLKEINQKAIVACPVRGKTGG